MSIAKKINLEKILSPVFKENRELMLFYKIAKNWEAFVEESFIGITQPLKLTKEEVLFVAIPNSSVSSQFYYSKKKILANISLHLGYDAVVDIKTILKPLDKWRQQKSHALYEKEISFSDNTKKEVDLEEKFAKLALSIRENIY
jgi:hypothetical protein